MMSCLKISSPAKQDISAFFIVNVLFLKRMWCDLLNCDGYFSAISAVFSQSIILLLI